MDITIKDVPDNEDLKKEIVAKALEIVEAHIRNSIQPDEEVVQQAEAQIQAIKLANEEAR